jgi:hypothetical protein
MLHTGGWMQDEAVAEPFVKVLPLAVVLDFLPALKVRVRLKSMDQSNVPEKQGKHGVSFIM